MTREEAKDLLDNLIGMVDDNQDHDYDEALRMGIEALEAREWIPCDEGKPDPYRRVLMTERRPDWNGEEYYIVTLDSFCNHRGDVVAWMLPPDPYKGDKRHD